MTHLQTINLIIGREFSTRVKKKSFIWITLLTPLFFVACFVIPILIMNGGTGEKAKDVIVVDHSGVVAPTLKSDDEATFEVKDPDSDVDAIKQSIIDKDAYALVVISPQDTMGDISVNSYCNEPLQTGIKSTVTNAVKKQVEDYKLRKYNITNLDQIMADISTDVKFDAVTVTKSGEKKESFEVYMAVAYILSFLIYIFILMFGGMVQRSVIEEKNSRVVEVIVSSIRSVDLMIGKIVGVALVALTQFLIWIVFTGVLLFAFQGIVGVDFLSKGVATQTQVAVPQGAGINVSVGDAQTVALSDASSGSKTDLGAEISRQLADPNSDMSGIVSGIKAINFPYVLLCFLLYFILGYLLYASMFAAVGSAVDNETDTNQLQIPITAPLIIGLFVMLQTFQHPDSPLSVWCSMIPWTSPMVMLARIPFGTVPLWQLTLSLVLLALTFIATAWLSGKIYRVGILSYGKKATWADLFKWMKYKK